MLAVLDLDREGPMEFVVTYRYYEGGGALIYRLKGGQPVLLARRDLGL